MTSVFFFFKLYQRRCLFVYRQLVKTTCVRNIGLQAIYLCGYDVSSCFIRNTMHCLEGKKSLEPIGTPRTGLVGLLFFSRYFRIFSLRSETPCVVFRLNKHVRIVLKYKMRTTHNRVRVPTNSTSKARQVHL